MDNYIDMYLKPYAEDDTLLNDWIDRTLSRVKWKLFERQNDWLYMAGELGKGRLPKFKSNAKEYFAETIYRELDWLVSYMVDRLVTQYRLGNIDLNDSTIDDLYWDLEGLEGGYTAWELEARRRIFDEYVKALGEERAEELAESWWGEDWRCSV